VVVLSVIVGLLLIVGITIGGYQLNWWLREDAVNRTSEINQDSYARQDALTSQVLDDIAEAQDPAIPDAQRIAIIDQICDSAAKLTGAIALPNSANQFIAKECNL
jgi:hypothetical protein